MRRTFFSGLLAFLLLACAAFAQAAGPAKVVYHLNAGPEQASAALEYIRNHLEVDPKATIVVVAHARGVDFLMKGAKTARGNEFRQAVDDLDLEGVQFRVCEITLRERSLKKEQFLPQVKFVPSGVAEIARLQNQEGFAYLKP
jgi:intracellular sulfur oxidation DsrE/DsrF family protein